MAKYNQLLRIEEGLGEAASFPGGAALARGGKTVVNQIHWTRAAVVRLAVASLLLIGALFLFVFPTSALLHQRGQLHDARAAARRADRAERALVASSPSAS